MAKLILKAAHGDNMEKMYWASIFSGVEGELYDAIADCTSLLYSTLHHTLQLCYKGALRYFFRLLLVDKTTSS